MKRQPGMAIQIAAWVAAVMLSTGGAALGQAQTATAASPASAPTASAPAAATPALTEPPRAFGHVLGDVLTQRLRLAVNGRPLTPLTLPPADRAGLWLERRPARTETGADGLPWLVIEYQVINAPTALTAAALPALRIPTREGPVLAAPAWPISLGPITPAAVFAQGDLQPLRPDRPVALVSTAPLERGLAQAVGVLAAVLLAWLTWWASRQWREARRLPFARATGRIRTLGAANPAAWRELHHALNATAGHVVHGATLGRLLAQAPHLAPLQAPLQAFYAESARRFFGAAADGAPPFALAELALALRDAERSAQR